MPVSALSLLEQQNRAGPSFRKESMVPIRRWSTENDYGVRGNEHDSKRADPLAFQGRHRWAGTFHRANVRSRCLIFTWFPSAVPSHIPVCDTAENTNDQGWWLVNDTGNAPSNAVIANNDFGADLYGDSRGPGTAVLNGAVFGSNNIRNGSPSWRSTPSGASNTLLPVAPAGVGADVNGLLQREVSVKSGNRP